MFNAFPPEAPLVTLECQVIESGQSLTSDLPWDMRISISTRVLNVVTTAPNHRASTLALTTTAAAWSWRDWRFGVEGAASVDRQTLRYQAEYRDHRLMGQCRRVEAPQ